MTQADQIRDDLGFIRDAVARRDRSPLYFSTPYYIWAVYVLIGYCLIDYNPRWAGWFFAIGWFPAAAAGGLARRYWIARTGEDDRVRADKIKLHYMAGGLLAGAAVSGLVWSVPEFRGPLVGQVLVVLFGMIYFLAGVHLDRSFLWLGPVLVIGGIAVGFVPHYGWSALGMIIAAGLCAVGIINSRRQRALPQAE